MTSLLLTFAALVQMVMPASLLVALSWSVFLVHTNKLALRVAIGVLLGNALKTLKNQFLFIHVLKHCYEE